MSKKHDPYDLDPSPGFVTAIKMLAGAIFFTFLLCTACAVWAVPGSAIVVLQHHQPAASAGPAPTWLLILALGTPAALALGLLWWVVRDMTKGPSR